MTVGTIAALPFGERPPLALLHLEEGRAAPDPDYAGYGWCRVPRVELAGPAGVAVVEDALLLAVHSCDDGEALPDDIELEFELGGAASVTVLLSTFLARWLPRLPAEPRAIVLVACNPHRARLSRPPAAAGRPVHYAVGDVESWLDEGRLRLEAEAWRLAEDP
jgi:hypothetical protein